MLMVNIFVIIGEIAGINKVTFLCGERQVLIKLAFGIEHKYK
jgi:hypothetical protein